MHFRDALRIWREGTGEENDFAEAMSLLRHEIRRTAAVRLKSLQAEGQHVPAWCDADEIADSYLYELRTGRGIGVRDQGGLNKDLPRYMARHLSPSIHEFWNLISDGLNKLRKEGKAWRIDDPEAKENNYNDAIWSGNADWRERHDPQAFEERAHKARFVYPRVEEIEHERSTTPRVIKPKDAEKLALDLLVAARGCITMREIMAMARRRVFLFSEEGDPSALDQDINANVFSHERIWEEADFRYERCAKALSEADPALVKVLCDYLLPRDLLSAHVTLAQFGDTSTVDSRKKKVMEILRDGLLSKDEYERGPSGPFVARAVYEIAGLVLWRLLQEFCRKNAETAPSTERTI